MEINTRDVEKKLMKNVRVHSLYWKNVDERIIEHQKAVYQKIGVELVQVLSDRKNHGEWMQEVVSESVDDIIFFSDIDAFPLHKRAFDYAVDKVDAGAIFGLAQYSNHKPSAELYAGPMFCGFRKSTWEYLGSPILSESEEYDAGELLTQRARQYKVPAVLLYPSATIHSKWALGNVGTFGIGTFYENNSFFHLFESRKKKSIEMFVAVAEDVLMDRPLNFGKYLKTYNQPSPFIMSTKRFNRRLRLFFSRKENQ